MEKNTDFENQSSQPGVTASNKSLEIPLKSKVASGDRKIKIWFIVSLVAFFLFTFGIAGYFVYQNYQLRKVLQEGLIPPISVKIPEITPIPNLAENWQIYANEQYEFEIKYPPEWEVKNLLAGGQDLEWLETAVVYLGISPVTLKEDFSGSVLVTNNELSQVLNDIKKRMLVSGSPTKLISESSINFNSYSATELIFENTVANVKNVNIVIPHNRLTYILQGGGIEDTSIIDQVLATFKFTKNETVGTKEEGEENQTSYYTGEISPQVPYQGLKFLEIDVHNFQPLKAELDENDFHYGDVVLDGYTFIANEGEDFEFIALEDRNSNPASFIQTELYGWGPTVIKMDTTIGWGVPATTRYFYVVKGEDFYGPNYSVSGVTPFNGSKYGKYRLEITQRK